MKKLLVSVVLVAALCIAVAPLSAHHGRGSMFDMEKQVVLKGTITEVGWRNPHVVIYMDVKDENGKVTNWGFENANTTVLARAGYSRNTLKVGSEITAIVNPARTGVPLGICVTIILSDGKEIMSRGRGNPLD
jgi:hypothetical protein